jgi:hypothetical protein
MFSFSHAGYILLFDVTNMPASKKVWSLKRTSLVNIAKNMEKIWMTDYEQNLKDQGTFLFVIGPFECLSKQDLLLPPITSK